MEHAQIPGDQRDYWNRVAGAKVFTHPVRPVFAERVPREARVLDVGCGYGRTVRELAELGYSRVTGVDTSTEMVRRGLEEHGELDLNAIDVGPLPFRDGAFDAVLLFAVLTCVPGERARDALLDEAHRVLAPGGHLYTSDLGLQEDARNARRYAEGSARYGERGVFELTEGVVLCHLDERGIARVQRGLTDVDFAWLDVTTMNGNTARAFQALGRRA